MGGVGPKIIVVAGNRRQYEDYLKENGLKRSEAIYASSPEAIRGLRGLMVVKTGEWWKSPCIELIVYDYGMKRQNVNVSVTVGFSASDVMELDRIGAVYGSGRAKLIRCVMRRFVTLPDSQIRAWLLEEERFRKKEELLHEKARIDKELKVVEKDLKDYQRGCIDGAS